jgi:hypothetical protein
MSQGAARECGEWGGGIAIFRQVFTQGVMTGQSLVAFDLYSEMALIVTLIDLINSVTHKL